MESQPQNPEFRNNPENFQSTMIVLLRHFTTIKFIFYYRNLAHTLSVSKEGGLAPLSRYAE